VTAAPAAAGFVEPAYGDRSLGDVLPAVARALGVDLGTTPTGLHLPEAGSYVVFLVDGLGHELLEAHPVEAPFLHGLLAGSTPATVGVPSTTATSLTSLGTALTPGAHGVVGFTSRIPGTDHLLNALMWSKEVDPLVWQPHTTAFARLAALGVRTTTVNKREFGSSGLTLASTRGADFVGADRIGERLVAVQQASASSPSLTYMYDGDLDWTGHRYGVDSPQWRAQLTAIDLAAEQPVDSAVRPRIGDVVAAARGDHAILATDAFPYEARLIGMHGSLTSVEMLVPVLVA